MLEKLRELLGGSELFNRSFKIEDLVNFEGMKFHVTDYSTIIPSTTENCTITIEVDGQTIVLREIKEVKWFK
jgi:hypothetical protein